MSTGKFDSLMLCIHLVSGVAIFEDVGDGSCERACSQILTSKSLRTALLGCRLGVIVDPKAIVFFCHWKHAASFSSSTLLQTILHTSCRSLSTSWTVLHRMTSFWAACLPVSSVLRDQRLATIRTVAFTCHFGFRTNARHANASPDSSVTASRGPIGIQ